MHPMRLEMLETEGTETKTKLGWLKQFDHTAPNQFSAGSVWEAAQHGSGEKLRRIQWDSMETQIQVRLSRKANHSRLNLLVNFEKSRLRHPQKFAPHAVSAPLENSREPRFFVPTEAISTNSLRIELAK